MIKPGELIDVVEMTPLTLADRRIYNMLIAHAWDQIDEPVAHVIPKKDLRGTHNVNDRIGESIERLMGAIVRVQIERDGKRYTRRVQLLGATDDAQDNDGMLYYVFPAELRSIIRNSRVFARLRKDVMYALSSKYALALYEMVQKRGNLGRKWSEEFSVERFRELLGVPKDKLESFKNLNTWAIKPAVTEVNGLSDFGCKVEPILEGRKVVRVRLSWWRKNTDEVKNAYHELQNSKVGRKARLTNTVEQVAMEPPRLVAISDHRAPKPKAGLKQDRLTMKAFEQARSEYPDIDIQRAEEAFITWLKTGHRDWPEYFDAAFFGFMRQYAPKVRG